METIRYLLIASVLAMFSGPAITADPAAEALEGAWLVSVENQARDRFLIVSGAKAERGEITVEAARYGWIDTKGTPAKDWAAQAAGNGIQLRFVTSADSVITARIGIDESTVSGKMLTKAGRELEVRMTRIPPEELEELRQAAKLAASQAGSKPKGPAKPQAKRDSKVYLVYVGASDCPSCRGYEAEYFGRKDLMAKVVPDFPNLSYVKASLVSYKSRAPLGTVPDELNWLGGSDAKGKPILKRRGVPFFALVVDDRIWAQGHGQVALETLLAPEIKRAMAEKRGETASPPAPDAKVRPASS